MTDALPLSSYRVLDLTNERGFFCGMLLACQGAQVIKIEPPGGDLARLFEPFYQNTPHPEHSLFWRSYNAGKLSITLNLETEDGRQLFKKLLPDADIVLESFEPGFMEGIGCGYRDLISIKPNLVMTSITPFGQSGPHRNIKTSDLTLMAESGFLFSAGDEDRPPVRISAEQAYSLGSFHGLMGTLLALWGRETHRGEYVDVSIHTSIVRSLISQLYHWEYGGYVTKRTGGYHFRPPNKLRDIWPCRDGYISWRFVGSSVGARHMRRLAQWIEDEGYDAPNLKDAVSTWGETEILLLKQEIIDSWERELLGFFGRYTKDELYSGACQRSIPLAPIHTLVDVFQDPQLLERHFWTHIYDPALDATLTYPRHLYLSSLRSPGVLGPAPCVGQHNSEIYRSLGLSEQSMLSLAKKGII